MSLFFMMMAAHEKNRRSVQLDESLIERIGNGDQDAFEELYYDTERPLYAFLLSLVRHHEDALDLMQDTYLKVRQAAHLYTPMGKPMAWIFTIARNLALTHLRSRKYFQDMEDTRLEDRIDYSYVEDPTDRFVLESAMTILSEEERQIILLYTVSGFKHREIGEMMKLPLSTVLSKYHRGLKKLRNHLKSKEGANE